MRMRMGVRVRWMCVDRPSRVCMREVLSMMGWMRRAVSQIYSIHLRRSPPVPVPVPVPFSLVHATPVGVEFDDLLWCPRWMREVRIENRAPRYRPRPRSSPVPLPLAFSLPDDAIALSFPLP